MSKLPEHLKSVKLDPDLIKDFLDKNPPKIDDYINQINQSNFSNKNNKVFEQIAENNKKKSFRETILFWIGISSIILAVASLVVSIIALKH